MQKLLLAAIIISGFYYVFLFSTIPTSYMMLFKIIPMLFIIILAYFTKVTTLERDYKTLVIIALIFCAVGDYTLQSFVIGLSCFLIGHVFYIRAFLTTKGNSTFNLGSALLILYGLVMLFWIGGTLYLQGDGFLTWAVCIYILIILAMGLLSFKTGSKLAILGATLFIISDSILAINRFIVTIEYSHQFIMLTYYGAQVLLALSIANYSANQSKNDTINEE